MTQRYDTYKDSGVQWLGEIPGHWGFLRNKSLLRMTEEKVGNRDDVTLLSLTKQGVIIRDLSEGKGKFPKDFETYLVVRPNNLVFCLFDIDETPRTVGLVRNYGMLTGAYSNFEVNEDMVLPEYAYYYYLQIDDVKGLRPYYTGLRKVVKINTFLQLRMPIPPLSEQRSIVSYLDAKCGKIDEWVTKKQKEVEHLQELKQRVIADTVTRGLNPHVKIKATNIPWLKEIPEHWECVKLKMFCQDNKEKNKGNIESCVLSLSYGNIIVKKNVNFGLVPENYESYQIVNPGNIILRLTDLQNDHKSLRTGLVKNRGIITSAYVGLIVKNMNSEYTQLILHSYDVMKVFYGMGGGLRQSMSYTDIANVYIPVPPLSEQKQIVSYLDAKCAKIDKLIANITKEIECIKEYKQRLISDVVTGQIKVC